MRTQDLPQTHRSLFQSIDVEDYLAKNPDDLLREMMGAGMKVTNIRFGIVDRLTLVEVGYKVPSPEGSMGTKMMAHALCNETDEYNFDSGLKIAFVRAIRKIRDAYGISDLRKPSS